jgi:hypothetical protein
MFNSLCQMQAHRCLVIIQSFNLLLSLTNAGLKGGHLHDPQTFLTRYKSFTSLASLVSYIS